MKYAFAYLILSCLVILNVPREVVHDCDHHVSNHIDDHHSTDDKNASFEQDHCFACEFQLDSAPTPIALNIKLANQEYNRFVETKLHLFASGKFDLFSLRGPPVV